MKRHLLAILGLVLSATALAAAGGKSILLVARDLEGRPLAGLRFTYAGIESGKTNQAGSIEFAVPASRAPPARPR